MVDRGDGGNGASVFRARARFYAIRQVDGEPVRDWYWRALAAAVPCGFGDDRPVADKFVTGLRPGPVADRLLDERADRLLGDLLAAAAETEAKAAAAAVVQSSGVAADRDSVLDEIREALKLYRYGGDERRRARTTAALQSLDGFNEYKNNNKNNHNSPPLSSYDERTTEVSSVLTAIDRGESRWKNRIIENGHRQHEETAAAANINNYNNNNRLPSKCQSCCHKMTTTTSSESSGETVSSSPPLRRPWRNKTTAKYSGIGHDDDSDCHCSWPTNDEKSRHRGATSKCAKSAVSSTTKKRSDRTKIPTHSCYVCDSDDKSFSQ